MKESAEIRQEEQAVGVDPNSGEAAIGQFASPQDALRSLAGINADKIADAFAVFGILARGDVNAILPEDRRGVDFAGAFRRRVFMRGIIQFVGGRVAVVLPVSLQEVAVALFDRFGITYVWLFTHS